MTENRLTDNEIIKALESCNALVKMRTCKTCPLYTFEGCCTAEMLRQTVDLINRQKEELTKNEKIIKAANDLIDCQKKEIERLLQKLQQPQSEAVKECLDKIELMDVSESDNYIMVKKNEFDNLVKEMVGEQE